MSLTLFSSTISSSKIGTSDTARMLLLLEKKKLKLNNNEIRTNYFSDKFPTMTRLLLSKNHHQIQPLFLGQFFGILHFNIDFLITEKKKNTHKKPNNIIDCETEKTESEWRHFSCSKQDNEFIMAKFVLILIFKFELLFY